MPHIGEIGNDGFTRNVLANGKSKWAFGFLPFGGFEDAAQTDVGGASVRDLDAYGAGAGDRSFDADFVDSEIERELFVASKDFAKVDAGGRLHGVLSDARANVGTLHLDLNTKLGEGRFNHKGILLNITGIGGGGFLLEEVGGRRLPIGVVHGD